MVKELEIECDDLSPHIVTLQDVTFGASIPRLVRLRTFDSGSWEDLTLELVTHWKTKYDRVVRCGGGGDMGRDIVAYTLADPSVWECYQCKHYQNKLTLNNALLEIGKVLFYAYREEFSVPKKYYFVSPLGVGTTLLKHLMDSEKLKRELILQWDKICSRKITKKEKRISLSGEFLRFVERTDFSVFDHIPPVKIIELHSKTHFHAERFGADRKKRPLLPEPPESLAANEMVYTTELVRAFEDADGCAVNMSASSIKSDYKEEYVSARKNFYAAEGLEKFSQDWLPVDCFDELREECYEFVSSTVKSKFDNGYDRYLATNTHASTATFSSHPLSPYIKVQDKKGICHQLVNLRRLKWVKD